jgi:uncharacterized protein YdeI (BOF family)
MKSMKKNANTNGKVALFIAIMGACALGAVSVLGAASKPGAEPGLGTATERITPIDEVRRGQAVVLAGTVKRISDSDEFVLEDESGRIKIYIGWKNRMPVEAGESVTVWGVADDDVFPGFRPEIYAQTLELSSGERIELVRGD